MNAKLITLIATLMILTSCGGGGGGDTASDNNTALTNEESNTNSETPSANTEDTTSATEDTSNTPQNDNTTSGDTTDSESNTNPTNNDTTSTDSTDTQGSTQGTDSTESSDNDNTTSSDTTGSESNTNPTNNDTTSTDSTDTASSNNTTQDESNLPASDEPYYKYSWHIDSATSAQNDEEEIVDKDADIGVTKAWDITRGSGVKVAVIDDGYDVTHEDLKDNISVVYSVDNDNNDVSNTNTDGSALHGNSCAGFIVSPINGKGSMGIAPNAKLVGIKLLSQDDSDTIKAFEYAQAKGAKVISCSWGSNDVSEAVVAKLKELYDAGITVLFASGNEGVSLDVDGTNDESEVEWVIGVGASGENNDVTSYSNYGKNIEVIAPGGDTETLGILGIDDMGSAGSDKQLDLVNNNYAFMDGTSFATPVAAGVVTLMYAANPNITPSQVKEILTSTATKIGGDKANYIDGFDEKRAYGKINAYSAVIEAQKLK
jgi:subtilisin family serine protease